jgi:hypothetical protein
MRDDNIEELLGSIISKQSSAVKFLCMGNFHIYIYFVFFIIVLFRKLCIFIKLVIISLEIQLVVYGFES